MEEESKPLKVACPECKVGFSENLDDPWYYENEYGNATCDTCGEVFAIYWDMGVPMTEEEWESLNPLEESLLTTEQVLEPEPRTVECYDGGFIFKITKSEADEIEGKFDEASDAIEDESDHNFEARQLHNAQRRNKGNDAT